ncbi:MAG: SDR family oxidoreductase [Desulfobacterales bacterium]|nr:SDR family oxidoreductase [Desulfobacterales bacterium]
MEIQEPEILPYEILSLKDEHFTSDNVCIITGAGSGIGRATAVAAAQNGLTVVGLDINAEAGQETCEKANAHGGNMTFIPTDLCDDDAVKAAVEKAADLGNIRYLANIAGMQHIDAIENFPMDIYDRMQKIMLRAPFLLSQLVIPHMKENTDGKGVIANMCSIHGHICTKNKPVYNLTKFGLRGLSQSISAEGEGKIRSFTVSTGFVKTQLALNQIAAQAEQRGITREEVVSDVMMGKSRVKEMMTPIEVGNMIIFGFSRHATYLMGGDLLFDGGMVLTY